MAEAEAVVEGALLLLVLEPQPASDSNAAEQASVKAWIFMGTVGRF
jgi:hypothetical protein